MLSMNVYHMDTTNVAVFQLQCIIGNELLGLPVSACIIKLLRFMSEVLTSPCLVMYVLSG